MDAIKAEMERKKKEREAKLGSAAGMYVCACVLVGGLWFRVVVVGVDAVDKTIRLP